MLLRCQSCLLLRDISGLFTILRCLLYSWVITEEFVHYLTLNADGSAYPAVRVDRFAEATILLPSDFILNKFHDISDCIRNKIANNNQQIQILTKTRDLLLPKLMSGKIRIEEGKEIKT